MTKRKPELVTAKKSVGDTDFTRLFAEEITALGQARLSDDDTEQVRRLVLDLICVARYGSTMPWARALARWAGDFQESGRAPVIGTSLRVQPQVAALVNGSASHGYELDDTHNASMSHPAAVIIPAVLAAASGTDVSASLVFAAIAAGYEAMARVGRAANAAHIISRGYHPTALLGPFGAAAGVAAIQGLDAAALSCAWGHALSLTGGSMQFSAEPAGTTVKRLHAGYGAQHGVLAVAMSAAGISAPLRSLDGPYGVLRLYGGDCQPGELLPETNRRLQVHDISMKPYSCCRLFHALIDALTNVTNQSTVRAAEVSRIRVRGPAAMFEQHMLARPRSVMAAQYSLPYVIGVTLAYGATRFDAYSEAFWDDPAILAFAEKLECERDAQIEATYPGQMGGAVEIQFADGSTRQSLVMESKGTPAHPLSVGTIEAKGQSLLDSAGLDFSVASARREIWNAKSAHALVELLAN